MYSANASLSQRSSHHCMVTRLPNHMCASSWATTCARSRRSPRVERLRGTKYSSAKVTSPAFSIAPALKSGTNTWSYDVPNGIGRPNSGSWKSRHWAVTCKISSASKCGASDARHQTPSSRVPCRAVCPCHGPPATEKRYGGIRSVGSNSWWPRSETVVRVLPRTTQASGASTVSVKVALRSGWSKQAKIRCASSRKDWP